METALDIIKANADDGVVGLVEGNTGIYPELSVVPGFTVPGDSFKTLVRDSWPQGGFKAGPSSGIVPGKAKYSNGKVDLYPYENPMEESKSAAQMDRRGVAGFLARVERGHFNGMTQLMARAMYYGDNATLGVPNAFPGLLGSYTHFVDATGTTADKATSVWVVRLNPDEACSFVFNENNVLDLGEWTEQMIVPDSDKPAEKAMGYVNSLTANWGFQALHPDHIVRIGNITAQSGKGLTDKLLTAAMEYLPANTPMEEVRIFMNRRAQTQLWNSRSAVGQAAARAGAVAERPRDFDGIPFTVSDGITNLEPIVS